MMKRERKRVWWRAIVEVGVKWKPFWSLLYLWSTSQHNTTLLYFIFLSLLITTTKQAFYIGFVTHSTSVLTCHSNRRCRKSGILQRRLSDRCRICHLRRRVSYKTRLWKENILHRLLAANRCRMYYLLQRLFLKLM